MSKKTISELKRESISIHEKIIPMIKAAIEMEFGSIEAFCKEYDFLSAPALRQVLNISKDRYTNTKDFFCLLAATGISFSFEKDNPFTFASKPAAAKLEPTTVKEQSKASKEEQKLIDAKTKEARRRWHKFRHLILPDPVIEDETQALQVIHKHIKEMFPIVANILDNLAVIGFVMVKDKEQNRFFLLQNQGWPNLVIPMDLEQCGEFCEHPFQNLFSSRFENICRYANEREIVWWYFVVFLPSKRKLEAMLEAGCTPDAQNMKHYFGADSIEFFGLVRNAKTGKHAPTHKLRHLEWDILNGIDCSSETVEDAVFVEL